MKRSSKTKLLAINFNKKIYNVDFVTALHDGAVGEADFFGLGFGQLSLINHTIFMHSGQHQQLTFFAALGVFQRIEAGGCVGKRGDDGGLGQSQCRRCLAEIGFAGLFNAGGACAEVGGVQIKLQNSSLL